MIHIALVLHQIPPFRFNRLSKGSAEKSKTYCNFFIISQSYAGKKTTVRQSKRKDNRKKYLTQIFCLKVDFSKEYNI